MGLEVVSAAAAVALLAAIAAAVYVLRAARDRARMRTALTAAQGEVAAYRDMLQTQLRVAKPLIDHLTNPGHSDIVAVASKVLPARCVSGDLVASAHTPDGKLHVLLADATGHGLIAALGALSVVRPFYALTERGFDIATIAREMNAKIHALLPTGRFVAVAIARIDPQRGVLSVWNGGIPASHLIDTEGVPLHRFASHHPPLGVLPDAEFEADVESFEFEHGAQFVIVSDGLIEAQNETGEPFGEQRMLEVLAQALPSVRLRTLNAAVHGHIAYRPLDDDISILIAECRRTPVPQIASVQRSSALAALRKTG